MNRELRFQEIRNQYWNELRTFAEEIRENLLLPLCKKHNLFFVQQGRHFRIQWAKSPLSPGYAEQKVHYTGLHMTGEMASDFEPVWKLLLKEIDEEKGMLGQLVKPILWQDLK